LRFAHDIDVYEGRLGLALPKHEKYAELRAPAKLANGKQAYRENRKKATLPVFPAAHLNYTQRYPLAPGTLSSDYYKTIEEPENIKNLPRV
jgi:hypothetical protein